MDTIETRKKQIGEFTVKVSSHPDLDMGPPWEEQDGHGIVSDWTGRSKEPGELVLCKDHGSYRFYDYQGTLAIAKRDRWGLSECAKAKLAKRLGRQPTAKEIVVESVMHDFQYLKDWCEDRWHWVGFTTEIETPDGNTECGDSVWGFDDYEYMFENAFECAECTVAHLENERQAVLANVRAMAEMAG